MGGPERFFRGGAAAGVCYSGSTDSTVLQPIWGKSMTPRPCGATRIVEVEVQQIDLNGFLDWEEFSLYKSPDPYDDFAWFTLTIGVKGEKEKGGNNFQVLVATPKAISRIKSQHGEVPGIIVNHFDPDTVNDEIRRVVSSLQGHSWEQFVDQLCQIMHWEYEGMSGG
ncbi:hypothetical protein CA54_34600 [Symmachiella macrocystis]|uniref:Immunity protein 8 n=1 Tax=Symmachiella macrocystis TaxID=2527985 RepID=A0A5C6BT22_9PLAN|nr:Imm8 family immunity protein [Symmachiella macrocystis]TWU14591.1 hypothetical protein CA54_34600 [Symmachiella macrocystis]